MKKIPKTFVASLFALSAVLCVAHLSALNAQTLEKTAADDAAEESTENALRIPAIPRPESVVSIAPNEVFFGDAFYVSRVYRNDSKKPVSIPDSIDLFPYGSGSVLTEDVVVILSYKHASYLYCFERRNILQSSSASCLGTQYLHQDEMAIRNAVVAETPPLEDWETPFWRAVREDVQALGSVELKRFIRISDYYPRYNWIVDSITIKKRPDSEMALLDQWRRDLDPESLPIIRLSSNEKANNVNGGLTPKVGVEQFLYYKCATPVANAYENVVVPVSNLPPIQKSFFGCSLSKAQTISELVIPLNDALRSGNRKPPSSSAPQSLAEWQALESQFGDGAVRDEIRLTALTLDYLAARQAKALNTGQKVSNLLNWLKELPYAQKIAFLGVLYEKTPELRGAFLPLIKENVDEVAYEAVYAPEANALFGSFEKIPETAKLLDPLLESGEANFEYDSDLARYKELGDEGFRELLEKMKKRLEADRKERESRTRR